MVTFMSISISIFYVTIDVNFCYKYIPQHLSPPRHLSTPNIPPNTKPRKNNPNPNTKPRQPYPPLSFSPNTSFTLSPISPFPNGFSFPLFLMVPFPCPLSSFLAPKKESLSSSRLSFPFFPIPLRFPLSPNES